MKNNRISNRKLLEGVSHNLPMQTPHSSRRRWRLAESHPGEWATEDTVADSPDSLHPVLRAVEECRSKPDGDYLRIVVILAPPDPAGSRWGGALAKRCRTTVHTVASLRQPHRFDQLLRPAAGGGRRILVIDQAGFLAREELGYIKLLINLTPVVLVLVTTPEAYRHWAQQWPAEACQINRRTHRVLERRLIVRDDPMI
jgi:hypothetical protein